MEFIITLVFNLSNAIDPSMSIDNLEISILKPKANAKEIIGNL